MKTQVFRFDIQALRALAVALVLVYHVWPQWLPAGYIGVDVFFVISGFLITGVLLKSLERHGRIDFIAFYLRRFRRLMPAASVVIIATLVLAWMLEPAFRQSGTAIEGFASSLYFQNWLLAVRATDYLDAERALGPLTHYWSLSIEEQFYLIWPLTLALVALVAKRRGWSLRHSAMVSIALISAVSLIASWYSAQQDRPEAYFVTHTRVWELGLGALLSFVQRTKITPFVARTVAFMALVVILASAFLIPTGAPFPGLIALIPTLATAAFLYVGWKLDQGDWFGFLSSRPIQFLGDASYSIYLWHWPLIYFVTLKLGDRINLVVGLSLILASLLIGGVSKFLVEDPLRDRKTPGYSSARATRFTVLLLAFSLAISGALLGYSRAQLSAWEGIVPGGDYPGAMMLTGDAAVPSQLPARPPLAVIKEDLPVVYELGCHTSPRSSVSRPCVLRQSENSRPTVVIVGDSHAANWVPTLQAVASQADWTLISITKSACGLMVDTDAAAVRRFESCLNWSRNVLEQLQEIEPDVVLLGRSRRSSDYASSNDHDWVPGLVSMLSEVLTSLEPISRSVFVLADTPRLPFDPPTCLAENSDCQVSLKDTNDKPDAFLAAAERNPEVTVIDLRRYVCPDLICPSIVGNIVVWRDNHHLTASYARSLAPEMLRQLQAKWPE